MKTIFVGNLAPDTTEEDLRGLFSQHGTVRGMKLAMDVFSGKCRGFALVDMEGHEARASMAALNGAELKGRNIRVNEEQPRGKRKGRGFRR
jgi:RNA recognition motif-containing protein